MKGIRVPTGFMVVSAISLLTAILTACLPSNRAFKDTNRSLEGTISSLGTDTSQLATQVTGQNQVDDDQQRMISNLTTQISSASNSVTSTLSPLSLTEDPTPFPVCTPPACAPDELYHCPDDCPGGCGTTCATVTPGVSTGIGHVWGEICFPGDNIPEMTIYFQEVNTGKILGLPIETGHKSYTSELPAGIYVAFAWTLKKESGGSYSHFVRCGGHPNCTDHNLLPFLIREGHVTTAVDICDWYGDTRMFPDIKDEQ
ncbi:MAG: hypothetical protein ACXADB_11490 [Candidatus Hermodarchaeia archaeon]|jgi:hypothetical protein